MATSASLVAAAWASPVARFELVDVVLHEGEYHYGERNHHGERYGHQELRLDCALAPFLRTIPVICPI